MAYCLKNNIKRFCAQSSGNTATALLKYSKHTGIEVVLFYLAANEFKLDPALVPSNVVCVEIIGTEKDLKSNLAKFSEVSGLPILPSLDIQT